MVGDSCVESAVGHVVSPCFWFPFSTIRMTDRQQVPITRVCAPDYVRINKVWKYGGIPEDPFF